MKLIMNLQGTPPFSFFSSHSNTNKKGRKNKENNNNKPSSLPSALTDHASVGDVRQLHHFTAPMPSSSDRYAVRITRSELETVLRRLGPQPPTDDEIAAMLAEAARRAGRDRSFRMEEILSLCGGGDDVGMATKAMAAVGLGLGQEDELKETFAVFDANGDGRISAEELHALLGQEGCTLDDCRQMIVGVDTDGDGFVCFEEFARMMTMDARRCGHVLPAAAAVC